MRSRRLRLQLVEYPEPVALDERLIPNGQNVSVGRPDPGDLEGEGGEAEDYYFVYWSVA